MAQSIDYIKTIKTQYEQHLLKLPNVVGVGIGLKETDGQFTDQLAIIVNVSEKKSPADLQTQDIVPEELGGILTDVQEVGKIKAL